MNKKRTFVFRTMAIVVLLVLAAVMLMIGRGHTVYFDNKTIDYNGQTFKTPYKVEVYVNEERVAKLYDNERGMTTNIGQNFRMILEITQEKSGEPYSVAVSLKLPYSMDGVIINLPALLAGQPSAAYLSEFISTDPVEEEETENEDDMGNIDMGEF